MNRGYVKLYRVIQDGVVFSDERLLRIFLYILLNVNHKKGYAYGVEILPGQMLTGRKKLAEKLNYDESLIQRNLNKLEKNKLITQKSNNRNRVLTVLNWDKFADTEKGRTTGEQLANNWRTLTRMIRM